MSKNIPRHHVGFAYDAGLDATIDMQSDDDSDLPRAADLLTALLAGPLASSSTVTETVPNPSPEVIDLTTSDDH